MMKDVKGHEEYLETDGINVFRKPFYKVTKKGKLQLIKGGVIVTGGKSTLTYTVNKKRISINLHLAVHGVHSELYKKRHRKMSASLNIKEISERFMVDMIMFHSLEDWEIEFYAESIGIENEQLKLEIKELKGGKV